MPVDFTVRLLVMLDSVIITRYVVYLLKSVIDSAAIVLLKEDIVIFSFTSLD